MLKVIYKSQKIEAQFNEEYASKWKYPSDVIRGLLKINSFFKAATSFKSIADYRPFHLELLEGKLKNRKKPTGEWSIKIGAQTGYRVILIPCDNQGQELMGGDILGRATCIMIIKITEVTNHYE